MLLTNDHVLYIFIFIPLFIPIMIKGKSCDLFFFFFIQDGPSVWSTHLDQAVSLYSPACIWKHVKRLCGTSRPP